MLIVESEHDDVVPHATIANYVTACAHARSVTSRVIKGADHGLSEERWQRAYTSVLVNWLMEMRWVQRTARQFMLYSVNQNGGLSPGCTSTIQPTQ